MEEFRRLCDELKDDDDALKDAQFYRYATDLELFALRFFPHYCKHPFNQFHYDSFSSFKFGERKIRRARAAPRGYAKSTIQALIKPIHDLCYGLEKFIVIFSNGEPQALGKLRDIRNELLTNSDLIDFYRISFLRKQVAAGSFEVFAGDYSCKFEAYGSGSQVRGIRYGAARPTKLVLDDVEHSEEVENESVRQKYFDWYQEDVVKIGDENTNIEFIGTVLHRSSLLKDLLDNPIYDSEIYKAVISWAHRQDLWEQWKRILLDLELPTKQRLANSRQFYKDHEDAMLEGSQVLWPEKEPYLALMEELIEGGRRAFFKEKQNEPLGAEDKLFSRFHWYQETERNGQKGILIEESQVFIPLSHCRAYGTMDPATGQTKTKVGKKGDFTCILTGLAEPKGRLLVHRDWTRRAPPTEYIGQIFLHHDEWEYEKFGVETNLYRNLLLPNIVAAKKRIEEQRKKIIKLPLYDIETTENKEKRIYTLEPKVTNGYILFNRALSQEFVNQFEDFPKVDHDDCCDALEMLYALVHNRYRMSSVDVNVMGAR
jgi:hypothetical protein